MMRWAALPLMLLIGGGALAAAVQYPPPPGVTASTPVVLVDPTSLLPYGGDGRILTPADPDIATVTTGGTAVNAFAAGHVVKGGLLTNPSGASQPLCVRLTGAAGTATSAGTICVAAGASYTIPPMSGAVSVNATDSSHVFGGVGYQ